MIVHGVDPRDIHWEDSDPVFRVYFRDAQHEGTTAEFELTDADLLEVLAWARRRLPTYGSEFDLYLRRTVGEHVGLVFLARAREG